MSRYIIDTNIFDMILDGRLRLEDIDNQEQWFVCPVQICELKNIPEITPDRKQRKLDLLGKLNEINPDWLPSSTFMLDTVGAGLDEGEINDASLVPKFTDAINQHLISKKKKSEAGRKNAVQDALILEVAMKHGLTLITADKALSETAEAANVPSRYVKP